MTQPRRVSARFAVAALVLAGSALLPRLASSRCEVGSRAGATVLYPYFEVDLTRADGLTTLISINNSSTSAQLVRVVLWTDWAIPALAFDVALRGKDVQTLNLRDVLSGVLPATRVDQLSALAGCATNSSNYPSPALTASEVSRVRSAFAGAAGSVPCIGADHGDGRARGYATADAVRACSPVGVRLATPLAGTPEDPLYFANHLATENVLWGDLMLVDPAGNSAQGVEAVALWSDFSSRSGKASFYGRFVNFDGRDNRSPLPTQWRMRFLNGGAFDGGTDLLVFREPRAPATPEPKPVDCGQPPTWFPLVAQSVRSRSEAGGEDILASTSLSLPLATQRVRVADLRTDLDIDGPGVAFGQLELDLRSPGVSPNRGSWVLPVLAASGRFSLAFNAFPVDSTCESAP